MFLEDQLRPITNTAGVMACEPATCSRAYVAWLEPVLAPLGSALEMQALDERDLDPLLRRLLPLVRVGMTRTLFVAGPPGWTVCFTNGWRGTDLSSIAPMLASRLGRETIRVTCVPDISRPMKRYGARIVTVWRGGPAIYRDLTVANDGGRWLESRTGVRLEEEDDAWFAPSRVRDRFDRDQLRQLTARLVPGLWNPDAWVLEGSVLVTRVGVLPENFTDVPLDEAQASVPRSP